MSTGTIYTKTLSGGPKKTLIIEPGDLFQRQTNLPQNWKQCRLGLIMSVTTAAAANATPTNEILANLNELTRPFIGLSNGVSYPTQAGNKFLGVDNNTSDSFAVSLGSAKYNFSNSIGGTSMFWGKIAGNGATVGRSGATGIAGGMRMTDPSAASACMVGFSLRYDVATAGTLKVDMTCTNDLTDAGDPALSNLLINNSYQGMYPDISGLWWDNTTTFTDCTFLTIRFPFLNNRLRIHNMMVIQTA